jgi:hypothetical protein
MYNDLIGWAFLFVPVIILSMGLAVLAAIIDGIKGLWFNILNIITSILASPLTWIVIVLSYFAKVNGG